MSTLTPPTLYQPTLTPVKIAEFARDMAIYGADDLEGVLRSHNITAEVALRLSENPVYIAEFGRTEELLADPNGAMRIRAQNMLPAGIDVVGEIAMSRHQPATARLKAVDMLTKIAQVETEEKQSGPSVVLHMDFGGVVTLDASPAQQIPKVEQMVTLDNGWTLEE